MHTLQNPSNPECQSPSEATCISDTTGQTEVKMRKSKLWIELSLKKYILQAIEIIPNYDYFFETLEIYDRQLGYTKDESLWCPASCTRSYVTKQRVQVGGRDGVPKMTAYDWQ
jgi:hypothetical protein